jgi:hypothetical protein
MMLAMRPLDFSNGAEGLAAVVLIYWDGTGVYLLRHAAARSTE